MSFPRFRLSKNSIPLVTCCVCLLILPIAGAEESDKEKSGTKRPAGGASEEPLVFTDDDLQRRFGKPRSTRTRPAGASKASAKDEKGSEKTLTPLEQLQEQQSRAAEKQQRVRAAEQAVADADAALARMEKQLTAARNPFAARVELTEDEKQAQEGWGDSAAERVMRTEVEVKKARRRVEEARKELAEARAAQ